MMVSRTCRDILIGSPAKQEEEGEEEKKLVGMKARTTTRNKTRTRTRTIIGLRAKGHGFLKDGVSCLVVKSRHSRTFGGGVRVELSEWIPYQALSLLLVGTSAGSHDRRSHGRCRTMSLLRHCSTELLCKCS